MSLYELADGTTDAPTSSDDTQITSRSPGGTHESGSTKDGELSRDGRFRWSAGWGAHVPTGREKTVEYVNPWDWSPNNILEAAAILPIRHRRGCSCDQCLTAAQHRLDWEKDRRNEW